MNVEVTSIFSSSLENQHIMVKKKKSLPTIRVHSVTNHVDNWFPPQV